ncbi:nuclear transport factor 2 family protein [Marinomonas dokdonensis]|uniref:nuclear transport factor 2 family protein n=1 Tax=Marinomonas dokdonensis TaxID=328224 RepID=UPI0040558F14
MTGQEETPQHLLIEAFKAFYQDVKSPPLHRINEIYAENALFKDPVHEIRGTDKLHAYLSDMCVNVESGRFEFLDQLVSEDSAYIKWNMHFTHPKLGPKPISVRGMTQVQFHERIYFHEDVYDLGQMLYEHVPFLGHMTKMLKKRMATS